MKKAFIFLLVAILGLGIFSFVNAQNNSLFGYIYSETVGWISLNCINTNSCSVADYGVSVGKNGLLSGYGFAQNGEWVNFNPNYGGTKINSENLVSGWVYSENSDWLKIGSIKIFSVNDLQKEITSAKNIVVGGKLSNNDTMVLLSNLCSKFLSSDECAIINK